MLATRYNGRNGHGKVSLCSVWNEPNIELFLTPQFSGTKIVGPANYAKLYKAAYAGIKAGNRSAQVAIGETSARGRDKPLAGVSDSVAPGTFARLLSQQPGLKFDAWAHAPVPDVAEPAAAAEGALPERHAVDVPAVRARPDEVVPPRGADLDHRVRPHQTKPGTAGVSYEQQATWTKQALQIVQRGPDVQMFIWFTFRDSPANRGTAVC